MRKTGFALLVVLAIFVPINRAVASISGGYAWSGLELWFQTDEREGVASFNVTLESRVDRIDSADFRLVQMPSREDGLISFRVDFSLGGVLDGSLNHENHNWNMIVLAHDFPVVNLSANLAAGNAGSVRGWFQDAVWEDGAICLPSCWHNDWADQDRFSWGGSVSGYFTNAEIATTVFGIVPEPATILILVNGAFLLRRRV